MAATVQIHEMTAAGAGVDKTSGTIRFKAADNTTVDTNDRLQVPASGSIYSYTKYARFYFGTAPSVDIQNLRCYTDGANNFGTGIGLRGDVQDAWAANVNTDILPSNWAASTAYSLGAWVKPTTANDRWYKCTTAGTSGATQPTWGTTIGGTTNDGTAVWKCFEGEDDVFTRTSGAPFDLDGQNAGPHTGTGYKGDFLRMQMSVASIAGPGQLAAETLTFPYDET